MIPSISTVTVQGDLGGAKTEMSIDESSLAHLMSILTDLYSDPELAVIREYSTNAWDSHVEASTDRPIEVSLPGPLSPYFRVKDYGVGLSVDEVTGLYSKYGASTKRDSNDYNGTLGVGAKSALTYCQAFTLISVKNGVKVTVAVSRNDKNIGVMEIVDTSATAEPNGVEIIIPSRNYDSMRQRAENFFRFWPENSVLIDGEKPTKVDGYWIADDMLIDIKSAHHSDFIVMGGVSYPVANEGIQNIYSGYRKFSVIAYVGIGEVDFAPSREALQYTPKTKAVIARLHQQFTTNLDKFVTNQIAKAGTAAEAIAARQRWNGMLTGNLVATWRGQKIPTSFNASKRFWTFDTHASRYAVQAENAIAYSILAKSVVITDYPFDEIPAPRRAKMRKWAEDNSITTERFIVTTEPDVMGSPWTDNIKRVSWNDVKLVKVDPAGPRNGKIRLEKYDVLGDMGRIIEASTFDHDRILFYSPTDGDGYGNLWRPGEVRRSFPNYHIAVIGRNRWDKFKRDWPTAQHISDLVKSNANKKLEALTENDKIWMNMDSDTRYILTRMEHGDILDPVFDKLIDIAKAAKSQNIKNFEASAQLAQRYGASGHGPTMAVALIKRKYPLAAGANIKHTIIYMNAVYNTDGSI